jgi:uncharacterized protein (UPF0276 family)
MKTLLSIALILIATTVFASPFLVSDPQSGVTSYHLTGWSETTVTAQADGSLRMDVGSAVQGTTYNLTIAACNVWGCSVTVPFAFGKQLPSVPTQLKLVP